MLVCFINIIDSLSLYDYSSYMGLSPNQRCGDHVIPDHVVSRDTT